MNSGLPINSTFDLDDETSENHHDYENDQEITERSAKRAKVDQGADVSTQEDAQVDIGDHDDVAPRTTTINDDHFDDGYNEESDEDWQQGSGSSSEEDSSSIDDFAPALVDHPDDETPMVETASWTPEQCEAIKEEARQLGVIKFLEKYVIQQEVPILQLLEVFDIIVPPSTAAMATKMQLLSVLKAVVSRHLRKRRRLEHVNTIEDVVHLLSRANNVMIVTGAGVSVSCGIPDFRSETGIYSRLKDYDLDDPQQMFDIQYFRESPEIFYSFAKELYPSNYEPSPSHLFVKLIEDKGKLLRNYTQNIDTLEHKANIKRVVNCHGSFATASCVTCGYQCEGKEIEKYIFEQRVPPCPRCATATAERALNSEQGDDDDEDDGKLSRRGISVMKPDITFFGESLPAEFDRLLSVDTEVVDLLIVMGSSLKVSPVSEIMTLIPHNVPQILINRTPITHMTFDVQLLGDCDVIVPELCRMLGWDLRHPKLPGGSALSDESWQISRNGNGDWVEIVDPETKEVKFKEQKIWKFRRNGLYTFPGADVSDRYLEGERPADEESSSSSSSSGDSEDEQKEKQEEEKPSPDNS